MPAVVPKLPFSRLRPLYLVGLVLAASAMAFTARRFFSPQDAPVMVDNLSDRAEEFITSQNSDPNSSFKQFNFSSDKNADQLETDTDQSITTECFSLQIPWSVRNQQFEKINNRCVWRAKSLSPLAHLVIATYPSESFNEDSGIVLRRQQPERYQEIILPQTHANHAVVFRHEQHQILFADQAGQMLTVSLNDIPIGSQISDQTWIDILASFTLTESSLSE